MAPSLRKIVKLTPVLLVLRDINLQVKALDGLGSIEGLVDDGQVVLNRQSQAHVNGLSDRQMRRQRRDNVVFAVDVKSLADQQASVDDSALSETDQLANPDVRSATKGGYEWTYLNVRRYDQRANIGRAVLSNQFLHQTRMVLEDVNALQGDHT